MKLLAVLTMVLLLPFAGCLALSTPENVSSSAPHAAAAAEGATTTRNVTLHSEYHGPGWVLPDQADCASSLGRCTVWREGQGRLTGTLSGTVDWIVRAGVSPAGSSGDDDERVAGSIEGCGTGTFAIHSVMDEDQRSFDASGRAVQHAVWWLSPGSASAGFARLVDARGTWEIHVDPVTHENHGSYDGYALCDPESSPRATSDATTPPTPRAEASDLHNATLRGELYDPGWILPDQVDCLKTPGHCIIYGHGQGVLEGTMNGTIAYTVRGDGSAGGLSGDDDQWFVGEIAGCGRGSFAIHSDMERDQKEVGPRGIRDKATWSMVPGSQSVGFAGLVEARGTWDVWVNLVTHENDGPYTGYALCR